MSRVSTGDRLGDRRDWEREVAASWPPGTAPAHRSERVTFTGCLAHNVSIEVLANRQFRCAATREDLNHDHASAAVRQGQTSKGDASGARSLSAFAAGGATPGSARIHDCCCPQSHRRRRAARSARPLNGGFARRPLAAKCVGSPRLRPCPTHQEQSYWLLH